jgi:Ca2+-dependent lipid-binding protein
MHLALEFYVGAYDWFRIPIPIYAIVEGFVATARLRVQFIQVFPIFAERRILLNLLSEPTFRP